MGIKLLRKRRNVRIEWIRSKKLDDREYDENVQVIQYFFRWSKWLRGIGTKAYSRVQGDGLSWNSKINGRDVQVRPY